MTGKWFAKRFLLSWSCYRSSFSTAGKTQLNVEKLMMNGYMSSLIARSCQLTNKQTHISMHDLVSEIKLVRTRISFDLFSSLSVLPLFILGWSLKAVELRLR